MQFWFAVIQIMLFSQVSNLTLLHFCSWYSHQGSSSFYYLRLSKELFPAPYLREELAISLMTAQTTPPINSAQIVMIEHSVLQILLLGIHSYFHQFEMWPHQILLQTPLEYVLNGCVGEMNIHLVIHQTKTFHHYVNETIIVLIEVMAVLNYCPSATLVIWIAIISALRQRTGIRQLVHSISMVRSVLSLYACKLILICEFNKTVFIRCSLLTGMQTQR